MTLILFLATEPATGLSHEAWTTAGVAIWMSLWWATEAIPVPATALLPLATLPLLGVFDTQTVADSYTSSVVYLLLGGFIVALGLQRWELHKRIALSVLLKVGDRPVALVGGFMAATAILSMWVSNTASTLMMLPIALSVAAVVASTHAKGEGKDRDHFTVSLVLAIAYSASIGGLGTMVGSPPNLLVVGFLKESYGIDVTFAKWSMIGIPFVLIFLPLVWFVLTRFVFSFDLPRSREATDYIRSTLEEMGRPGKAEKRMAAVFACVALAWMFRPVMQGIAGLGNLSDTGIAVIGAMSLFLIPSGRGGALMNWETAKTLPWDVLLLYGGGMALSGAISSTGLAAWVGDQMSPFASGHLLLFIVIVVTVMIYLTEIMNNSAAAATFLPIIAVLAITGEADPVMLAIPVALAASCAFMFPVATPPNAIVYACGAVTLPQMVSVGFRLNFLGVIVVPLLCYLTLPLIFS